FMITLLLLARLLASTTASDEKPATSSDPMKSLNGAFRAAYDRARTETVNTSGPIILASGDRLTLIRGASKIEGKPVPRKYHDLKTVAHVPLTIYVSLAPYGEGPIGKDRIEHLTQIRQLASDAKQAINELFADKETAAGQQNLLRQSIEFLSQVLENKECKAQDLLKYISAQHAQILSNVQGAVKVRVDSYHQQAMAWRSSMPAAEWARLHVVVQGASMPRKDNLTVQYFSKLLGQRGEGLKIIYAESIFQDSQALKLLGTHLLDTHVSNEFFSDDPWRMHRDLLGSAAGVYIDSLQIPQAPDSQPAE
ncbi:MAG: hypothetical protein N2C12_18665, partial [Planctomycetales bacterium]